MSSKLRNLVEVQKPEIRINVCGLKQTYTTLNRIEGVVTVTAPIDTCFDAIDIDFVGTSRTYVERLTAAPESARSEGFHQFLKLAQPGLQQQCPEDKILRSGHFYEFPFVFTVPEQLLPHICQHAVQSDAVRDAHYRLPPSFGDKDLENRSVSLDDMAPDTASVRYGILAKITEIKSRGEKAWRSIVASKTKTLRVIPAVDEQPPLDVHEDTEYVMRTEKMVKKGVLQGKLGTVIMEAAQPQSLRVWSYNNPDCRTITAATVTLRFDPIDDNSPPPRLGSLTSKLKVITYIASSPCPTFPTKQASRRDLSQRWHTEQLKLSSRCVANVEWLKQDLSEPPATERCDSASPTSSPGTGIPAEPSPSYTAKSFYIIRLSIPITLPKNKAFVPTFHSCLISRVYDLKLELRIRTAGIGPSMELKVPVQISSEGFIDGEFDERDSVDSANNAEIDAEDGSSSSEPRTIRTPSGSFLDGRRIVSQTSTDNDLPEYSQLARLTTSHITYHRGISVHVCY